MRQGILSTTVRPAAEISRSAAQSLLVAPTAGFYLITPELLENGRRPETARLSQPLPGRSRTHIACQSMPAETLLTMVRRVEAVAALLIRNCSPPPGSQPGTGRLA